MLNNLHRCRVCGLLQDEAPWGEDGCSASFNICDCCGTEFGYEDATLIGILRKRERWLADGAQWFSPKATPSDWNLQEQLQKIPEEFRGTS